MLSIYYLFEQQTIIKQTTTKNFKVDDFKNPAEKSIKKDPTTNKPMYRRKAIYDKRGKKHLITFAIKKFPGPKGGKTQATSIWHSKK